MDPKEQLKNIEAELNDARDRLAVRNQEVEKAKAKVGALNVPAAKLTGRSEYKAALAAIDEKKAAEAEVKALEQAQVGVLKMLGEDPRSNVGRDQNGPRIDMPGGNGWAMAAEELGVSSGSSQRVEMRAADLMRTALASLTVTPDSGLTAPTTSAPFLQRAQDRRYLYPQFDHIEVGPGVMAISEYRQVGARTVTGEVERDPVATTEKAKLALKVELETPPLKQFAVFIDEVPVKLFDVVPVLRAFLENELRYQIDLAVDEHVVAQIEAATPPSGKTGATLIEQSRHAVAAVRAAGGQPTILALNPTDAADLDIQTTGANAAYIFATRDSGSSSPLWNNQIVEVPELEAPLVIDPTLLGALYSGLGTILLDPYSGLPHNQIRVRAEIDGLFHIRDTAGVYKIA